MVKTCILYARVSTTSQTTENQLITLRATAQRMDWKIVAELVDHGISGSKGELPPDFLDTDLSNRRHS